MHTSCYRVIHISRGKEQKGKEPFCRLARRVMTRASAPVEMYRFYSWYCIYIVVSTGAQRGRGPLCAPTDDQSCLIVFASIAAAGALILRHIPFRSPGQAFIAWAYQVDKGSSLNNWTISYQGWHPYKDVPLTASAQTGEWIKPHSFVPKARPSSSASDHKISATGWRSTLRIFLLYKKNKKKTTLTHKKIP